MELFNETTGTRIADQIGMAGTFWSRARGLLGRKELKDGEGLIIVPCSSIHSFGMRFVFDAVFLDGNGTVIHLISDMPPNRVGPLVRRARYVIELRAGTVRSCGIQAGHRLNWR